MARWPFSENWISFAANNKVAFEKAGSFLRILDCLILIRNALGPGVSRQQRPASLYAESRRACISRPCFSRSVHKRQLTKVSTAEERDILSARCHEAGSAAPRTVHNVHKGRLVNNLPALHLPFFSHRCVLTRQANYCLSVKAAAQTSMHLTDLDLPSPGMEAFMASTCVLRARFRTSIPSSLSACLTTSREMSTSH